MRAAPFKPDRRLAGISLADAKAALCGIADISDKFLLWHRQGGRCFYCDEPMIYAEKRRSGIPVSPRAMTIDHVFTRTNGGRQGPKVGACFECNSKRGVMPAHDFILLVAYRQGLLSPRRSPVA